METNHEVENLITSSIKTPPVRSYYQILEVSRDCSRREIRESYIRLKKAYSSRNQAFYSLISDDEAKKNLELIDEAFRVLDDSHLRQKYDAKIDSPAGLSADSTLRAEQSFREMTSRDAMVSDTVTKPRLKKVADKVSDAAARKRINDRFLDESDLGDGLALKEARKLLNVSMSEVHAQVKISLEYLKAIEENAYDNLPATTYVRGFLVGYLKYMGVEDPKPYINAYIKKVEAWYTETKKGQ
ncbi:MAG: helix-turn-helix domain-containing protein [Oligoflexales bacterium]